jgi:hypothetical protein
MTERTSASIEKVVTKVRLGEAPKAASYWRSLSYQARLDALEEIRQEFHGWKKDAQPRLQRVYTIIKRITASAIWWWEDMRLD